MALTTDRAQPLDFLEAVDDAGRPQLINRRTFGLWARQVAGSHAITLRRDGQLVAIVGIYDLGLEEWELWFAAGPGLKRNLRAFLEHAIVDLEVAAHVLPGAIVRAYIHPDSVAGGKIARWLGFRPCAPVESPLGLLDCWRRDFP